MKIEYPLIRLKNSQTGILNTGYLVGNSLVVTKSSEWEIWNVIGTTLFRNIESREDAIQIALWLNDIYTPYFAIWRSYPEVDIFELSMWSMPDGRRYYETIENMRLAPKITWKLVLDLFQKATGRKYYQPYINIQSHDNALFGG